MKVEDLLNKYDLRIRFELKSDDTYTISGKIGESIWAKQFKGDTLLSSDVPDGLTLPIMLVRGAPSLPFVPQ